MIVEKGQAPIFLDRFFQAFGHAGVFEVGGQTEFRVRKSAEDGGGTYLDGEAKDGLTKLLQKVMSYRNAFAHGELSSDGTKVWLVILKRKQRSKNSQTNS